jgi:hypothetical protein
VGYHRKRSTAKIELLRNSLIFVLLLFFVGTEILYSNQLNKNSLFYAPKYFIQFHNKEVLQYILVWITISSLFLFFGLIFKNKKKLGQFSFALGSFFGIIIYLFIRNANTDFLSILNNAATFSSASNVGFDLDPILTNTKCFLGKYDFLSLECIAEKVFIPYGNSYYLIGILILALSKVTFTILMVGISYGILFYTVDNKLGAKWIGVFCLNPWMYFATERANIDLIFFILIMLTYLNFNTKISKIIELSQILFYTIKPNFLGFIFVDLNKRTLFKLGAVIILSLASYEFSLDKIRNIMANFKVIEYGGFGLSAIINFLNEIFFISKSNFLLITILIIALLFLFTVTGLKVKIDYSNQFLHRSTFLFFTIYLLGIQVDYKLILIIPLLIELINQALLNQKLFWNYIILANIYIFILAGHLFLIRQVTLLNLFIFLLAGLVKFYSAKSLCTQR